MFCLIKTQGQCKSISELHILLCGLKQGARHLFFGIDVVPHVQLFVDSEEDDNVRCYYAYEIQGELVCSF